MRRALLFLFCLCLLSSVFAHGFGNERSIEVGDRVIEMGLTDPTPRAGERVGLSFSMDRDGAPIHANRTSVRIAKGNDIYFVSDGFALDDVLTMSFLFPEPGTYEIEFHADDLKATFPLEINRTSSIAGWIFAAVFGLVVGILIPRRPKASLAAARSSRRAAPPRDRDSPRRDA